MPGRNPTAPMPWKWPRVDFRGINRNRGGGLASQSHFLWLGVREWKSFCCLFSTCILKTFIKFLDLSGPVPFGGKLSLSAHSSGWLLAWGRGSYVPLFQPLKVGEWNWNKAPLASCPRPRWLCTVLGTRRAVLTGSGSHRRMSQRTVGRSTLWWTPPRYRDQN